MISRLAIFAVMACFAVSCNAKNNITPKPREYALGFGGIGWTWTVCLNDIPILWEELGGGQIPITCFVKDGKNTLSVKVSKRHSRPVTPLRLQIRDITLNAGQATEVPSPIINIEVDPKDVTDVYEKTLIFDANVPITWTWQTAEEIKAVSEADRHAMESLIAELKAALANKDMAAYKRLRKATFDDISKLYGNSKDEQEPQMPDFYKSEISVEMRPMKDLTFIPRNRVIYVGGPMNDWIIRVNPMPSNKLVTTGATSVSWSISSLLFVKVCGEWIITN